MSTPHADEFYERITNLYPLYEKVKLCIIYAENFDPKEELYIAPINQLRSALDHIFKAANHPTALKYELKEAKEHLDRAGYDAFEVLASCLGKDIIEQLKRYSPETLAAVFPEYYTEIKPKLVEVRTEISDIRLRKKSSKISGSDLSFDDYFNQVTILTEFHKTVNRRIPSLEEYRKKTKRIKIVKYILGIVFGTILLGLLVNEISSRIDDFRHRNQVKTEISK